MPLIQSASKGALQKNIATEIKAGKDPRQAAAIAYSVQRKNDSEEKNYKYIMYGTTGEKEVTNLTQAEAEALLKNNRMLGYDGKIVKISDANEHYILIDKRGKIIRHAKDLEEARYFKSRLIKLGESGVEIKEVNSGRIIDMKNFKVNYKDKSYNVKAKDKKDAARKVLRKLDGCTKELEDDRLSPMTYKKLKEMGYDSEKWKNLTQEQANKIVASGKVEPKGGISKEKPRSLSQLRAVQAQIEHRQPRKVSELSNADWVQHIRQTRPRIHKQIEQFTGALEELDAVPNDAGSDRIQIGVLNNIEKIASTLIENQHFAEWEAIEIAESFVIPSKYNSSLDYFLDNVPKDASEFKKSLSSSLDEKENYLYSLTTPNKTEKINPEDIPGEDKPVKRDLVEAWNSFSNKVNTAIDNGKDDDDTLYGLVDSLKENIVSIFEKNYDFSKEQAEEEIDNLFSAFAFTGIEDGELSQYDFVELNGRGPDFLYTARDNIFDYMVDID